MPTLIYCLTGNVAAIMLLRWGAIEANGLGLKEEIWFWLVMLGPWIPITIWLRPKLRIITKKRDADRLQLLFQILAFIVMAASSYFAHEFIRKATAKLVTINSIQELRGQEPARFYAIKNYEIDTLRLALSQDIRTGNKNKDLDIDFFIVAPFKSTIDKYYWFGVTYRNTIDNRGSDAEKEAKYNQFHQEAVNDIRHYNFYDVTYFKTVPRSKDLDVYFEAMKRIDPGLPDRSVVLEPVREPFNADYKGYLFWTFASAAIGLVVYALLLSLCRYSVMELERQRNNVKPKSDDIVDMLTFMVPRDPHFVTSVILDINILVMLLMIVNGINPLYPNGSELMEWGALRRDEFRNGEWWRLLTSMFVHGGLMHLAFNIYGLVFASMLLEPKIGRTRFLLIYLATGMVAGFASVLWTPVAGVGASGAIFGLFGALLGSLLTDYWQHDLKKTLFTMLGPYVGINLLIGFFLPGIGNAAHIGGLVAGFLIGYLMFNAMEQEEPEDSEIIGDETGNDGMVNN